jgi:hypothetical protein
MHQSATAGQLCLKYSPGTGSACDPQVFAKLKQGGDENTNLMQNK